MVARYFLFMCITSLAEKAETNSHSSQQPKDLTITTTLLMKLFTNLFHTNVSEDFRLSSITHH